MRVRATAASPQHSVNDRNVAIAVIVSSILCGSAAVSGAAAAQSRDSFEPPSAQRVGKVTQELVIPAGSLAAALEELAKQTGADLVYRPDHVAGLTTAGVKGEITTEAAIIRLLEGTPLKVSVSSAGAYLIAAPKAQTAESVGKRWLRLAQASNDSGAGEVGSSANGAEVMELETVIVTSERLPETFSGGQVARGSRLGLLGNRDIMDTPFSTTAFTAQFMQDVGARSLAQVLTADPSVRLIGSTSQANDTFDIRGFYVAEQTFDGLFGVAPPLQVAAETVERVELIKGPTALLGGMSPYGSIGGIANLAPKRAGATALTQVTAMFYTDSLVGAHVDVGRRFGSDDQFGVRFNGVYRDGDGTLAANSRNDRDAVIGLDYRQGGFRLTGDLGYQRREALGTDSDSYMLGTAVAVPRAPDADRRFFQPWNSIEADATYGVVRAQFQFTPETLAYVATGFNTNEGEYLMTYASGMTSAGDFNERFWGRAFDEKTLSTEAGLRLVARTGVIEHQLAIAAMTTSQELRGLQAYDSTIGGSIVGTIAQNPSNIYAPNFVPGPQFIGFSRLPKTQEKTLSGVALADTLSFNEGKFLVTLGARLQKLESDSFDPTSGLKTVGYNEQAVSPAAAIVFRPAPSLSFYVNYMEGLTQGPVAPGGATNAGEVFSPYASEQIEAGVKWDRDGFGAALALFEIAQPNGIIDASQVFDLNGERRHRGVELSMFGEPIAGLRVLGGIMLLEAELTKTQGGINDGNRASGPSEINASLGVDWRVPFLEGLGFSARGVHMSSFYLNDANTRKAPAYTVANVGGYYTFLMRDKPMTVRLNVENVFDKAYWQSQYLYRGAPRTVLMSATFNF